MAGTRIKQVNDISATAVENTSLSANATAAQAQAWLDSFEIMMLAAGFVRTADTGQYATVSAALANGNVLGYRIYALNDEYSSTSPLIVKVTFAGRGRCGTYYRMRVSQVDVGFATDGAGNLTGTTATVFTCGNTVFDPSFGTLGSVKSVAWRKDYTTVCIMQPNSSRHISGGTTIYTCEFFFAVSRLRDEAGNVDTSGFMVYGVRVAPMGNTTLWYNHEVQYMLSFRITPASALALGGSPSNLLYPSANYRLDSNNQPVMQGALWGRTLADSQYGIGGIYMGQDNSLLNIPGFITGTGPDGDLSVYVAGTCFHPLDIGRFYDACFATGSSSSVSFSIAGQTFNTNMWLALDWS